MKRYAVLLTLLILIIGTIIFVKKVIYKVHEQEVSYKSGIYHNKVWNNDTDQVGVIDVVCVPDKETAVSIANIIFEY